MRLVVCVILLAVFSSCAGGPRVTPCIYGPSDGGAQCAPANGGEVFFLPQDRMENFACFSPNDTRMILEYIKRKGNRAQSFAAQDVLVAIKRGNRALKLASEARFQMLQLDQSIQSTTQ